jgi:hypothetical protein
VPSVVPDVLPGRILTVISAGPIFMTNDEKFELVFPDGIA